MGLRLAEGLEPAAFEQRFGVPVVDWTAVERYSNAGLLDRDGDRIRTTSRGRLVLDSLLAEIAA